MLSDGKPIPPGIRVTVGADQAWDSQMAGIGADGSFGFSGLPPGVYGVLRRSRDIASAAMEFGVEKALVNRDITGLVIRHGASATVAAVGGLRRLGAHTERRRIGSTASSRRPKEEIVGFKRVYTFNGGARSGKLQS